MTREEAFDFYRKLERTGRLEKFLQKSPSEMTKKEKDLFYFDDREYFYNPWAGKIDHIVFSIDEVSELSDEDWERLGLI